ncbi:MAG: caspase family protein, partial [Thermoguttaceae bacterium]|nr:caspase family protein [Thermoguttaceae bacterium]
MGRGVETAKKRRAGKAAAFAFLGAATVGGVCVDSALAQGGERALATVAKDAGKCGALLVGVDEYYSLTPLNYAGSDAGRVGDALKKLNFAEEGVRLLTSGASGLRDRPSRKAIIDALDEMLAESDDESTVFVFLSGHGFETEDGDAAFCPEDVDVKTVGDETVVKADTAILLKDV